MKYLDLPKDCKTISEKYKYALITFIFFLTKNELCRKFKHLLPKNQSSINVPKNTNGLSTDLS